MFYLYITGTLLYLGTYVYCTVRYRIYYDIFAQIRSPGGHDDYKCGAEQPRPLPVPLQQANTGRSTSAAQSTLQVRFLGMRIWVKKKVGTYGTSGT